VVVQELRDRPLERGSSPAAARRFEQGALQLGRDRVPVRDRGGSETAQDVFLLRVCRVGIAAPSERRIMWVGNYGFATVRREPIQIVGVQGITLLETTIFRGRGRRLRRGEEAVISRCFGAILLCCEHDSALLEGGVQPVSQSPAPLGFVVGACWQWNPYGDEVDELKGANSPVACIRASPQNNSCRRQLGCDKKRTSGSRRRLSVGRPAFGGWGIGRPISIRLFEAKA